MPLIPHIYNDLIWLIIVNSDANKDYTVVANVKFLSVFGIISHILWLYYFVSNYISLAGKQIKKCEKYIQIILDRIARKFDNWPYIIPLPLAMMTTRTGYLHKTNNMIWVTTTAIYFALKVVQTVWFNYDVDVYRYNDVI